MPRRTLPALAMLIAAAAGCSSAGGVRAAALETGTPASVPAAAGSSASGPGTAAGRPGTGITAVTSPAPGVTTSHGAAKTPRTAAGGGAPPAGTGAAAAGTEPGATPAGPPPAPPGGGTVPVTSTTPAGRPTPTPPQDQASGSPSPAVSLTPAAQVTCTVTGYEPVVRAVVTPDEAGPGPEDFHVNEYDTAGLLLERVVLPVPGPLAAGETVSAEGAQDTPMTSCQVTAVSGG